MYIFKMEYLISLLGFVSIKDNSLELGFNVTISKQRKKACLFIPRLMGNIIFEVSFSSVI